MCEYEKSNENVSLEQERFLDFLLNYATLQTSVGVQTSRIVLNTTRIAETYGYDVTMMLFQRNVAITITPHCDQVKSKYKRKVHATTALTHHRSLPLNFQLNAELSRLSWWVYDNKPNLAEIETEFEKVLSLPRVNRWIILALVSCANAAFCLLFDGDFWAAMAVFVATVIGFWTRQELNLRHAYHYFVVLMAAFLSSFVTGSLMKIGFSTSPQIAISTSVLYLIPGVPIINGIMDFFDGYILNGISRLTNALLIIVSIAVGVSLTLFLLNFKLV